MPARPLLSGGRLCHTAQSLKIPHSNPQPNQPIMKNEKNPRFINGSLLAALAPALPAIMQAKTVRAIVVCAFSAVIFVATANAGPDITWQTPVTISGTSDVSTLGALYGTWAPGNDWGGGNRADYFPVNGVTFAAYGTDGVNFGLGGSGVNLDRYN